MSTSAAPHSGRGELPVTPAAAIPRPADPPAGEAPSGEGPSEGRPADITWEIDVPLLRNSTVVGDLARVCAGAAVLMGGLLTLLLFATGEPEAIPPILAISVAAAVGLFALGLIAMAMVYRGRMRFRYTITSSGLRAEVADRTARRVNRAVVLLGLVTGRPGVAGTGLLAASQEMTEVAWRGAFRASFDPRRRTITFRNAWRRLFVVHASPDGYEAVAARVQAEMHRHGTATRAGTRRSPLPWILAVTIVAAVASIAVFPLADAFDVSTLLLTIMVCFALATIWLIGLFGWVVIACAAAVGAQVILSLLEVRESFFSPGTTYRHLDVLGGDDLAILVVAAAGLAVLIAISVAALRGRLPSMLERDAADAGI